MDKTKEKQNRKRDILLIAALLATSLAAFVLLRLFAVSGGEAVVYVNGVEAGRFPLNTDAVMIFAGYDGGTNTVKIEGGAVAVVSADCPDRLCVRTRAARYDGESIICLPHRLTVKVESGEESGVDIP